ncbi:MAG: SixA phosphatase family protein [Candidatus Cyclobacteriaceae bacterium M3_2C_046]
MKTLYLIRHAKSSWDYDLEDFDRPLNHRGRNDAPLMGRILSKREIKPDLILSSPALRAIKTAVIIATEIQYEGSIEARPEMYHANSAVLWQLIRDLPESVQSVMVFGHNPGFTDLANVLTTGQVDNIPTCGVFAVKWEVTKWKELNKQAGSLLHFDYPKKHKA